MSWWQKALYGVDLDEEQRTQDALKVALTQQNELDRTKYGEEWDQQAESHNAQGYVSDVEGEVGQAFDEGLEEGANNVTRVLSKPLDVGGKAFGAVLSAIPWWVWLGVIAAAFFYFGGGERLKKSFK